MPLLNPALRARRACGERNDRRAFFWPLFLA